MSNQVPTTLINLINTRLSELEWSQRQLSRASGVSSGAINNLLRGESVPETATVEKIADALGISRRRMLESLAGSNAAPESALDASALYIAKRLTGLPEDIRALAIDALGAQLDAFYEMVKRQENLALVAEASAARPDLAERAGVIKRGMQTRADKIEHE